MAATFVPGKWSGIVWTPLGGSSITFNVTDHTWSEMVDALDVTHSGSLGVQDLIAGIGRGEGNVKANLDVDTGKIYFDGTNLIRAGQKGLIDHLLTLNPDGSSAIGYQIPCMIIRVNSAVPVNGVISYDFDVGLASSGHASIAYGYNTTP